MTIHNQFSVALLAVVILMFGLSHSCFAIQSGEGQETTTEGLKTNESEKQGESVDVTTVPNRRQTKFLRLLTDEYQDPVALQTATAKYVLKNDVGEVILEVFLEGVIPVADASYYRSFQRRFERYDCVLYASIVKQEKQEKQETDETGLPSGLDLLQQLSTGTLGLAYQFDEINYQANGMLHSDLNLDEIAERMADRGDDQAALLSDLVTHVIRKFNVAGKDDTAAPEREVNPGNKLDPKELLSVFTDPDGIMKIRRLMASSLVDSKLLESEYPPSIQKMIIGDRNDRAMSMFSKQKNEGKRRIAFFFGVGHMADFEQRLTGEYGMKLADVNWRNAWDLRDGAIEGAPLEGLIESAFRDSVKNKLRQFAKGARNKKSEADANERTGSENDQKIEALERALKELEARLEAVQDKDQENKTEPDKSNDAEPGKKGEGNETK